MEPSVPELLVAARDEASEAGRELSNVIREISWAFSDLRALGGLPDGYNDGRTPEEWAKMDRDAMLAEFATRAILPGKIPAVLAKIQGSVDKLRRIDQLVQPLPEPKQVVETTKEQSTGG